MRRFHFNKEHMSSKILCIVSGIALLVLIAMTLIMFPIFTQAQESAIQETVPVTEETLDIENTVAETETIEESTEATEVTEETFVEETEEVTEATAPTEDTKVVNNSPNNITTNTNHSPNTWDEFVGIFSIPSVGLSVNCYSSYDQSTVDATNSAAYFYSQSHLIIADHVNQGFDKIKHCSEGTRAYINGTEYECVDVMRGHNNGSYLATSNGTNIRDIYPGTLVAYTCNSNWQDVTLVFFKVAGTELEDFSDELGESSDIYPSEDGRAPCAIGAHNWYLEDSWEYLSYEGVGRSRYLHEHFICSRCNADWVKDTLLESDPDFTWDEPEYEETPEPETYPTEPEMTEPPVQETEPPVVETEPFVPEVKPTVPQETETPVSEPTEENAEEEFVEEDSENNYEESIEGEDIGE